MPELRTRPDYGLDAPGVVRMLLLLGALLTSGAILASGTTFRRVAPGIWWIGLGLLVGGLLMILSSRFGKLRARDRLLDSLGLTGSERVLDVGCGHGLLLIGAAKRLPGGEATGIDLWSARDQARNSAEATLANARLEGVADRVRVETGDMRALPFPDGTFDAVVLSLAIHNVPGRGDRARVIREIVRVLRPGGRVAILDIGRTAAYGSDFRAAGMVEVRRRLTPWIYPPAMVVTGGKPST